MAALSPTTDPANILGVELGTLQENNTRGPQNHLIWYVRERTRKIGNDLVEEQ